MRPLPLAWRPRVACALAALAFTASVACAQTSRNEPLPHYQFQRLTVADGLPENSITSLIQDRQGFLWFGTPNGLVRYDGREVKVFRQRSASRGAQLGAVTTVIEDARGGIWAGAGQDGLWHLDRRTGRWTTYQHDPRDEGSLSGSEVTAVVEAAPGRLLVVSRMPGSDPVNRLCIDRLDTRTGQVRHFRIRGASVNAPAGDCMLGGGRSWRDARGRVWLGSGSGAFRYDPRTDSLLRIPPAGGVPYGRDRYEALDAVFRQGRMLAAIRQPGNRVDQTVEFRLDRPSPVLIAGGGEIEQDYPYDYGWIENTRGDTVWAMRYGVSAWMGGNATNRLVVATRTLPAGRYRLRYHSDWAESMEGWVAAPERPDLWGIRIAVLQAGAVRDAGRLETRPLPPRGPRELPNTSVQVLGGDATGGMWFGFAFSGPTLNRGPLQYDPLTSHVAPVPLSAGPEHLPDFLRLTHARAISMLSAPGGVLWFGTDRGLYRLERGRATRYSFDAAPMGPLNQIREITDGGDGTLWLGVGQGAWWDGNSARDLIQIDPISGRYRRYVAGQGDPTGLGGDGILNLLRDRQGNLWVGTGWGGLHRLDRTTGRARLLEYNASRPGAFPAHRIMDMTEAPDGAVWAVSDSGLFRLDLRTLTARRHSAPGELLGYGAFVDRDGNLWTTTYPTAEAAARLVRRDARSGRVLDVFPRPNQRPFPSYMIFNAVYRDPTGILWLAMSNVGLLRFDPATGASHQYPVRRSPRAGLSDSLDNGTAYAPVMDRDGMLWVGTSLGGLNRLDPRTGQFRSYFDRAMGIRTPGVILEDRKGRLWFGTYRNGLFMLDRRTGRNTRYTTAQGLAHDFVAGIVEDEAGFLWLNTGGGVSRFDPERRTFRTFGPRDGVPSVGNPHAALGTRSGRIFFSGSNGILVFDPRALSETAAPLMLALETASFRFPSGQDSTRYLYDRQVDVSHDATDVMFTFNGLDYVRPDAVRYQYRLYDGDEPDGVPWTEGGALGLARYTSIPPGRYRFEVRAASADGHWSAPQRVRLVVHPPWWQTGWAYALYALAVAGLLALLVQAVRHRARQRERERLREERERAKDRELAQAKEIEKAYTQLKATQQQLIQQEKLASLGALTAGIAHEIKNPLNFVNNFAQLSRELVEEIKSERGEKPELRVADVEDVLMDLADNVARIEEHGRRADGIVKNMLMHARSGSGRREPTPLNALVEEAANLAYHGMRAQRAGVDVVLETSLDPAVGVVSVVPQEISRVVLNLAGNALYAVAARKERAGGQGDGAAPGESFVPTVRVSTHAVGGAVEIRVWDNGGGIPEAVRAKVFEPFFTTKPAGEGTGLGLSLSHDIVAAHGGALGVESAGGETTFTLTLPTASVPEDVTP